MEEKGWEEQFDKRFGCGLESGEYSSDSVKEFIRETREEAYAAGEKSGADKRELELRLEFRAQFAELKEALEAARSINGEEEEEKNVCCKKCRHDPRMKCVCHDEIWNV